MIYHRVLLYSLLFVLFITISDIDQLSQHPQAFFFEKKMHVEMTRWRRHRMLIMNNLRSDDYIIYFIWSDNIVV